MFKEFKEFAIKGNALDLAVGVVVGAAFTQIVNSLVNDIITPPLAFILGKLDFSNLQLAFFGRTFLRYGSFLNALLSFLVISFAIFLIVKQINRLRRMVKPSADTKQCPYCQTLISTKAMRCPHCTSSL